jgi:rubrerythrin
MSALDCDVRDRVEGSSGKDYVLSDHGRARRRHLASLAAGTLAWGAGLVRPAFAGGYTETIAAMQAAQQAETLVNRRYREFGRQAKAEGYFGVAYLFYAFAASELIHAQNFQRVLARLGVDAEPARAPLALPASTKENLVRAANDEMHSIEAFYPRLLERLKPEGHADAITYVTYAWESERQHRDVIRKLQQYSPTFFETVAKTIDMKTGTYYVCQICGSTVHQIPDGACPVCKYPPEHYRRIEPPA